MLSFTLGKLIRALTVLLGVSFLSFIIGHSSGDQVRLIARGDATEQQRAQLRHSLGLDRPVLEQYRIYVGNALHGDLGVSYRQHVDVSRLIALRLPNSLELAGAAFVLAMGIGCALGVLCVTYRDSVLDNVIAGLSVLAQVVPGFWLGLVLVLLFAVHWRVLPVSGSGDLTHLILPEMIIPSG